MQRTVSNSRKKMGKAYRKVKAKKIRKKHRSIMKKNRR